MKLNIAIALDRAESVYSPVFQSLLEGIQHQYNDCLRVFLVRPESLGTDCSTLQLRRLQEIEHIVSGEYSGTVFIGCSLLQALGQVSLVFPDQPVTWISPHHSIGIDSVRYLVNDLWHESFNAVVMSPISKGLPGRTHHRLNNRYFNNPDRKLEISLFAVLRDLSLNSCNLIWPGHIFGQVSNDVLQILQSDDSGKCDEVLIMRWALLCTRVRLAELSIAIAHAHICSPSESTPALSGKDSHIYCLALLSNAKQDVLLRILLAVLIDTLSEIPSDSYVRLQSGDKCLSLHRKLYDSLRCSLVKHLSDSLLPELISRESSSDQFASILHHSYFSFDRLAKSCRDDASLEEFCDLLPPLIDPGLASSVHLGIKKLPPRSEVKPTSITSTLLPWSFESSSLSLAQWFRLSERLSDERGEHAACFNVSATKGQAATVSCIAAPCTLHQITLVIPAKCAGKEIRVNFDLREGSYVTASGEPIAVEMTAVCSDCWSLQVTARAEANFDGPIQLRTCKNNSSYYKPSGSGSIYYSCVEYSLASSDSLASCSVSSFAEYRSDIAVLDTTPASDLPLILSLPQIQRGGKPALSIRVESGNHESCVLSCHISGSSSFSLSRILASGAATVFSPPDSESAKANSSDHSKALLLQSRFETHGVVSDLRLEFDSCHPKQRLFGLIPKLIISSLSFYAEDRSIGLSMNTDPIEPTHDELPLVSVIGVAYKMHHLVPGWLSNYALQTIHELGGKGAELLIADVELSLPLLLYILGARLFLNLPIRLVPFEVDPGLYESWNSLIRLSRSRYITNFNPDDRKLPDHLASLCLLLEQSGAEAAASACHVLRFEPGDSIPITSSEIDCIKETWWSGDSDSIGVSYLTTRQLFREPELGSYRANNILHSMPVWRRSLHSRYGFFDETSFGTYADYAFWIAVLSAGENALFVDAPLYLFSVVRESHNRVNANSEILGRLVKAARLTC